MVAAIQTVHATGVNWQLVIALLGPATAATAGVLRWLSRRLDAVRAGLAQELDRTKLDIARRLAEQDRSKAMHTAEVTRQHAELAAQVKAVDGSLTEQVKAVDGSVDAVRERVARLEGPVRTIAEHAANGGT